MIGIDTNVLMRYLAQDDPGQSRRATAFLEKTCTAENPGFISAVVLVEVAWVAESCYSANRREIAVILEHILRNKQLVVEHAEEAWAALNTYKESKADFSDCLIERVAHTHGCDHTVTFDKKAARAGLELLV